MESALIPPETAQAFRETHYRMPSSAAAPTGSLPSSCCD